ncbi:RNA methyltransferase [Candidatus Roizmanbacteria bacterium CG10_big_fil_rev_8_21_14_0_10_45_7]|uniref:RNA methyltransferase n=1 Tax=Candidatus Roizmanbacteria bacterium CG10_big_fil_rev_8_21_14_0_10_45_7 TaxID=1974854 RepID=A0A2M8KUS6_9BACT|nr:MAG: RNA methyltransferase [Candidatus Roizmanbacteria bacterium CG10_big_fil_rev_8_21_14_0_10_45_7]
MRIDTFKRAIARRQADMVVVLEDLHDPHNAAAIARTCEGFGIQNLHLIFEHEPSFNPKKLGKSTSSSANKWLTFHSWRTTKDCFDSLKKEGYSIIGTTLTPDAIDVYAYAWPKKIALVFGNEHNGLSDYATQHCDAKIMVPMQGMVQSFNVSVSVGIVLGEVFRVRSKKKGTERYISEAERALLLQDFLKR